MLALPANEKLANSYWDLIKNSVEKTERRGQIPESIKHRFPQTLEEALKFYGIKNQFLPQVKLPSITIA